ncbi:MAG: M20/M25/M40 family metallo-hydrolase [Clostridia bacterium]|nr:M20/M25/M40 family metallo-hydrolase [Clostridia bacterium]
MDIKTFIEKNKDELYRVHRELCLIPAPSHYEDERAAYCKAWLEGIGAEGVYIDEAKNVVFPYHCESSRNLTVISAHTDTVFPMDTPLNFTDDGKILRCPGVGDDTGCLAVMLFAVKYLLENRIEPKDGLLVVCNSCEEGLGNLKGIRQICRDYEGRIKQHISVDWGFTGVCNRAVGSTRYEVSVHTEGGHSFGDFGHKNAIAEAAKMIAKIYELKVPVKEGCKTTYNVGTVSGGTTVNTIAQNASFLCEYRSDDVSCMDVMKEAFLRIFGEAKTDGVDVDVKIVGERPCGKDVDENEIARLSQIYRNVVNDVLGLMPVDASGSTDCNIPLSLGIPSVCIGGMTAGGEHTVEEWADKASFLDGIQIVTRTVIELIK